ncbi:MAG TPA: pentapeptide repeat-containing protein [Solirubrobacteraceae bacterium]
MICSGRTLAACAVVVLVGTFGSLVQASAAAGGDPLVRVDGAKLVKHGNEAVLSARISWNRAGIADPAEPMVVGDVRLLAVVGADAKPVPLKFTSRRLERKPVQDVRFVLQSREALDAIRVGNRVVLTASQHAFTATPEQTTTRTYVTVKQLQAGQPRRVGLRDCSDQPIVPHADLTECDLVGASLASAQIGRSNVRTELLKADLTGADLRYADLSHVDLAGGRVNGANATNSNMVQMSLAGGEGIGFIARKGTKFDFSDFFAARLDGAKFTGAQFPDFPKQVSFGSAHLNRADFQNATLTGTFMQVAQLRGANLRGANLIGADVYFANLDHAKLKGATVAASVMYWTLQCHTELPGGGFENRDCTRAPVVGRQTATTPLVVVGAALRRGSQTTISGTVHWNEPGVTVNRMRVGEIRAVAVDAGTGLPTGLGSKNVTIPIDRPTTKFSFEIAANRLASLRQGNRVVVTATQHPAHPDPPSRGDTTKRSYVTVDQLQKGPIRGRVGSVDCSDRGLVPAAQAGSLRFCDLVGAALADADLSGSDLRMDDLTGADLRAADLSGSLVDGGRLAGVAAALAQFDSAHAIDAYAPKLQMPSTPISGAIFDGATLNASSFAGSTLTDTRFAAAQASGASFAGSELFQVDLAYSDLAGANLSRARASREDRPTSLFLAELRKANLRDSKWVLDEERRYPPTSGWLCRTTMPDGAIDNRDCPRR